jgi:LacI family transcriptional regulator
MAELNYSPNGIARSLRGRRTRTVGLIVPDNANPFYAETARAVEAACADAGFALMLSNTSRSTDRERASIALLLEKRVDGIIVATSSSTEVLAGPQAANVPLIVLDHDHPGLGADAVLVDHGAAASSPLGTCWTSGTRRSPASPACRSTPTPPVSGGSAPCSAMLASTFPTH